MSPNVSSDMLLHADSRSAMAAAADNISSAFVKSNQTNVTSGHAPTGVWTIAIQSLIFCIIEVVGIGGNLLVIVVVLADKKMRRSATNLFITNLAIADFIIMLFGISEIIQFILDQGWLLGQGMCQFQRFVLVASLYSSILTQMAVCAERYIAIVHPIKAHLLCSRSRILVVIALIWPLAFVAGLPTVIFNTVRRPPPVPFKLCLTRFPGNHAIAHTIFKLSEFIVFFLLPVILQMVLYAIVSCKLFSGTKDLYRKQKRILKNQNGGESNERESDAIRSRKGVVKMLIASVLIYFCSYVPQQIPLFYNLISATPFQINRSFIVSIMTLSYINSAANPILYAIFSQKFRLQFRVMLCCCWCGRRKKMVVNNGTHNPMTTNRTAGDYLTADRSQLIPMGNIRKLSTTMVSELNA